MKKLIGMIACVVVLAGCGNATQEVSKTLETAQDGKVSVVASFYPLAYLAERIGGESVAVTNVIGSSDPHDYTLSPRDITMMQDANLVLLHGSNFESWAEDMEEQLEGSGNEVLVVTEQMELLPIAEGDAHDEDGHEEEGHDEGGHEEESADEHDEHNHGSFDPHVWHDPVMMQEMTSLVLAAMIQADEANQAVYEANAQKLLEDFSTLDADFVSGLASCERDEAIVSHDAFGYLTNRYGFTLHSIAGISTQDEPSAQTLAQLKEEAAEGITHILTEENTTGRFAATLSTETGLSLAPINALASADAENEDFFDRARLNLTSLQTALGCAL